MTAMVAPSPDPGRSRARSATRWWAASAALLIVAAGLFGSALWTGGGPAAQVPVAVADTPPAPPADGGAAPAGVTPLLERSAPVRLSIPAIGVAVAVTEVGLNPDRTVEVPTNFALPGWYGLGTAPGQAGSAVILGHVDSYRGPAVFSRLSSLQPGAEVEVTRADGAVVRFAVTEVATYPKDRFPAQQVYGAQGGNSTLVLVTCGGEFDTTTRTYRSNVVAYASLVAAAPDG